MSVLTKISTTNIFYYRRLFLILSFFIPFIVYLKTNSPTVSFIDTGELATVCISLGIAHPTGYPLFTLLGKVFSLLPFGQEIYRLNLMCSFISSITILIFYKLLLFILDGLRLNDNDESINEKNNQKDEILTSIVSLASSLILAFSNTFWDTATSLEVYSLHTFFIVSVIFAFLKALDSRNSESNKGYANKYYYLFAFLLGLSFTNHLSTIFLSVGLLYIFFAVNKLNRNSITLLFLMALPFLIGLSVYIYFPIRANNQILSWGYPINLENIYRHISGKQFGVWMFSSTESATKQFTYFLNSYPKEFGYIGLLPTLIGLFSIYIRQKRFFLFTFLLFSFNILYAINYDIHDIDTYFLLAYITTSIWIAAGFIFIVKKLKFNSSLIFIIPLLILFLHFNNNDKSDDYYVEEYTMNVFNSAKPRSIIVSTQWDFWVSASFYYQFVKDIRKDIVVIDKELLRKSWYLRHIKILYPEIYGRLENEFLKYEEELIKFERNTDRYTKPQNETDRQNLLKIQNAFSLLLNGLVDKNIMDYNFYTTFEIEQEKNEKFGKDYFKIPEGLLIRYTKENKYDSTFTEQVFKYSIPKDDDYYHNFIINAYYMSYLNRANYLINNDQLEKAEGLIDHAFNLKPGDKTSINLKSKIKQLKENLGKFEK